MSHQAFTAEAIAALDASPYQEFIRRPGMSIGLYRLPVGGTDAQHPHAADEVYIVLEGNAQLVVEGTSVPVAPGSVISVDRGKEHAFTDITQALAILVVFAPPEDPATEATELL